MITYLNHLTKTSRNGSGVNIWKKNLTKVFFSLIFYFALSLTVISQTTPVNFSFTLTQSSRTSAGVFNQDGTMIRTLWSGSTHAAGTHNMTWDKKDDAGNLINGLNYVIKVVSNNVTYTWDGVVGNTSKDQFGKNKYRHLRSMWDICFASTKGYYCTGFVEGNSSANKFNLNDIQTKEEITPVQHGDINLEINYTCTDGNYVYWSGFDAYGTASFTYATKVSDESEVLFSNGSSVSTQWGRTYPKAIDILTGKSGNPSGNAVQKNGNYLFISHNGLNQIKVFNKTSGALVTTHSITAPKDITCDSNGDLWVISGTNTVQRFTVNSSNGTLSSASSITGITNPISMSCYGSTIAIVDEGTSQVKCFNIANGNVEWTLGQANGYATDATVADDKFFFWDNNMNEVKGFVSFGLDGSIWVGDVGNNRLVHFSSQRVFVERIMYISMLYQVSVCRNDPTRVFAEFLEFKIDYSKTLAGTNGSWELVKNWKPGLNPSTYLMTNSDLREAFKNCIVLPNGRTYGTVRNFSQGGIEIMELVQGGRLRATGVRLNSSASIIAEDGTITYMTNRVWYERKLTGFQTNGNPNWASPVAVATAPNDNSSGVNGWVSYPEVTSTGVFPIFEKTWEHSGYHFSAIKRGDNKFAFKTCPSTSRTYTGAFPTDGTFDVGNGVEYPGGNNYTLDRSIFWNYIGEFWKNSQVNKWHHYYDNGLMIAQFGITTPEAESKDGKDAPRMAAGNAFHGGMVKYNSDYYLYHCDESVHGGIHRWKISNLNSIKEEIINLNSTFVEINVRGNSVDISNGDVTPSLTDNTDLGSVNTGSSVNKTFVIQNTGTISMNVTGITISGTHASDFTMVSPPTYPLAIAANGSYTITVKFEPLAGGTRSASISIANSDPDEGAYSFALRGVGIAQVADIQVTGNGVAVSDGDNTPSTNDNTDYGSVNTGSSVNKSYVISNAGAINLSVTGITLTGTNSADFTLVSPPSFPMTIAPSGTATITVKFEPLTGGTKNAVLTIANSDLLKGTFDFAIRGNAVAPQPAIKVTGNGINITDGDLTPSTVDNTIFTSVIVGGNTTRMFTISNTGNAALSVTGINFTGTNANEFTIVSPPTYPLSVAANATYDITVRFAPTATGVRNGMMNIISDDQTKTTFNFALQGTGLSSTRKIYWWGKGRKISNGDMSPEVDDNTDYGTIVTGNTKTNRFEVNNEGNQLLTISSIEIIGSHASEFSIVNAPAFPLLIPANSSVSIDVKFAPLTDGYHAAEVKVTSDDPDESLYNFAIYGKSMAHTSVYTVSRENEVLVYPNPTNGLFHVKMLNHENAEVRVFNSVGKMIYHSGATEQAIDLRGIGAGIYTVNVITNGESVTRKIIVQP